MSEADALRICIRAYLSELEGRVETAIALFAESASDPCVCEEKDNACASCGNFLIGSDILEHFLNDMKRNYD